jgi:hypothetical protein
MLADGIEMDGVTVKVPDSPGLGIKVPEERIRENLVKVG